MDKDKLVRLEIGAIVLFAAGVFLKLARPVLVPLAMALLVAYAVSPVLDFLVARKVPRALALTVILVLTCGVLYLVGNVFYSSGKSFASELPAYNEMVDSLITEVDGMVHSARIKADLTNLLTGFDIEKAGKVLVSALGPFMSFFSGLFLVIVFLLFMLAGRGRLAVKAARAFPKEKAEMVVQAMARIDRDIQRYLAAKTAANLVMGVVTAAVLAAFQLPFAVLFGILAFLVNYIPTLGTIIGVAVASLLVAVVSGSLGSAVLALVILGVAAVVVFRLLERKLMKGVSGLSPLLMLFALFFCGWLWGLPGMILAVPFLVMAKIVLANIPGLEPLEKMMER